MTLPAKALVLDQRKHLTRSGLSFLAETSTTNTHMTLCVTTERVDNNIKYISTID